MMRTLIIGDIHGCSKTFRKLVEEVVQLQREDVLYLLGDYIDRGPDSKGVIDFILELRRNGYKVRTLRGNHEQQLLEAFVHPASEKFWLKSGAPVTLESFNISSVNKLPDEYIQFFNETEFFVETGDFILAHAGLNFTLENPLIDFMSMMWIRDFEDRNNFLNGRLLIHGHTPLKRYKLLAQDFRQTINMDGGCAYRHIPNFGNLFALDFYARTFYEVRNDDV